MIPSPSKQKQTKTQTNTYHISITNPKKDQFFFTTPTESSRETQNDLEKEIQNLRERRIIEIFFVVSWAQHSPVSPHPIPSILLSLFFFVSLYNTNIALLLFIY